MQKLCIVMGTKAQNKPLYPYTEESIVSIAEMPITLYHQLAETLAEAIHQGTYMPGCRLPAIRRCASNHQVSVNTVLTAYRILEDRGLIEARPQSGYYVRDTLPSLTRQAPAFAPRAVKNLILLIRYSPHRTIASTPIFRWRARRAVIFSRRRRSAALLPRCCGASLS